MVNILKKNFFKIFKEKVLLITVALTSIVFFIAFFQISYQANMAKNKESVMNELNRLKQDFPELLHDKVDLKLAKRLAESLRNEAIIGYEISHNNKVIESWFSERENFETCQKPITAFITKNAIFIGRIKTCLSSKKVMNETLSSPYLILVLFISVVFMLFVGFFPLFSLKKSMKALFDWRNDPTKEIKVDKNDDLALQIASSIREFHENRVELEQTKIDYESDKEVFRITRQVGHDISSPAEALKDQLNVAKLSLPDEQKEIIGHSLQRILEVCAELKDKNKKGVYSLNQPKVHNVGKLVSQIIREKESHNKKLKIIKSAASEIEAYCDPAAMKRILSNILNNSIEACSKNHPIISVSLTESASHCELIISDNGKGIPKEVVPFIFEKGYTHGKDNGTGLGLHHARFKLESWGGKIEVLETSSTGTRFKILLQKRPKKRRIQNEVFV